MKNAQRNGAKPLWTSRCVSMVYCDYRGAERQQVMKNHHKSTESSTSIKVVLALTALMSMLGISAAPAFADDASTVLITGGNRGLGFDFVNKYAAQGWNVIATARKPDEAVALQQLAAQNSRIRIEQLDITDPASVDALGARLTDIPIDVLLNNAGMIGEEPEQQLGSLDPDRFNIFMRTNALGALLVSERLLPNVRASQQKKIVAISALAASFAQYPRMHRGLYFYKASKVALNMIMRNLAMDTAADGVLVTVLSPGVVDTANNRMPDMPGLVDMDTSINGMMQVIAELTPEQSGQWLRYTGKLLDW